MVEEAALQNRECEHGLEWLVSKSRSAVSRRPAEALDQGQEPKSPWRWSASCKEARQREPAGPVIIASSVTVCASAISDISFG